MNGGNMYGHQQNENPPVQNSRFPIPQGQQQPSQMNRAMFQVLNSQNQFLRQNPQIMSNLQAMYAPNMQQAQMQGQAPVLPPGQQQQTTNQTRKRAKQQPQKKPFAQQPYPYQQQFMMHQQPQQQPQDYIKNALSKLPDDTLELFFKLYNIQQKKTKDQRIQMFIDMLPELNQAFPDAAKFIANYQLANPESIKAFRDPLLPSVFQRTKGTSPSYFLINKNVKEMIEYMPSPREIKQNDMIIGTFITIQNQPTRGKLFKLEKDRRIELQPVHFGEMFESFVIHPFEQMPLKFVLVPELMTDQPTFLIIQMVTRKSWIDVVTSLTKNDQQTLIGDTIQASHTINGVQCQIDAVSVFEETCNSYNAICPRCRHQILLKDLSFSFVPDTSNSFPDSLVADYISVELYAPRNLLANKGSPETYHEEQMNFNFGNTNDYLSSIDNTLL